MDSRQVKDVEISNGIRTTYFTDDTKLVEQLFDAKLVSGKPTSKLTDNTENQNVSLGFDVTIDETDEKFNALVYENYLEKVRETNPDAFGEGDSVVLAISVAKNRDGEWTKYGRLSLPKVVTANDVISDDMLDPAVLEAMRESESEADVQAEQTQA